MDSITIVVETGSYLLHYTRLSSSLGEGGGETRRAFQFLRHDSLEIVYIYIYDETVIFLVQTLIDIPRSIVPRQDEWSDPIWPEERVLSLKTT